MKTAKEYRQAAEEKMSAYSTYTVLAYFLMMVILGAATSTVFGGFLIEGPLMLGFTIFIIGVARREKPSIETLFKGFENFVNAMLVGIIQMVLIFLWSLLFLIPGIIKAYAYQMSYFILNEEPTIDPMAALKKSEQMMEGHKWQLFCLHLSYIGWILLGILTAGILLFWVVPKINLATYEFYLDLKQNRNVETVPFKEIR